MWTLAKFVVVLLSVALSAVRASSAASHASTTTTPTPLTTSSPTPSTEPSDPAWRCGFEEDVCGMTQYEGEWTRDDSLAPQPAAHGAWHVRVGDSVGAGASAGLQTPSFSPGTTARRCLAFYYYLDGADAGRLSVRLRLDGELQDPLWTRLSPAGQHWWAGHVDLLVNQSFSVAFEGTRGGSAGGLLALDEVALFDQPCTAVLHAHNPNVTFFCDLEEDLCGLTLEAEQGQWLWTSPQDPALAQYPHPALDHTYNTAHGKYLVAPLWDGRKGVVGRVVTEEFPQEKPQHQCLSFWYLHNGATHHDQLTVYLSHDHHMLHTAMWRESVNHQNTWLEANVPIPVESNQYAVVWEAKQNERHDQQGYMALDDMEILMQDCAHIGTCDFEVGTCGWQNLYVDNSTSQHRDVDWLQGSAAANTDHLTPFTDHNGDTTGKFLYVGAADGSVLGRAVLESQLLVPEQYNNFCFSFWFFLQGQATDSLWMEVEGVDAEAHLIWQQNASATLGQWQLGQVHVSPQHLFGDNSYQIFITGERGSEEGIIAVDDFNFGTQTFHCPLLPDQPTQGDTEDSVTCDFTVGTCGWQNVETESISWVYDGEKQEVHLELSDSATAGSPYIGQLRSPTFNSSANTTSCLSVTWFMETETESQFSILVEDEDGSPKFYLMSVSTGSGGQLKTTNMEINQAGTLRIALQGTAIPPYVGTMSVNFVMLKEKPCPGGVAGGNLWCDFEDPEECGFSNSQLGDDAQWTWGDILPPIDHTLSSSIGHNMFVYIASVGKNKIAHLVTPDITPVDPTFCATFWFYLTGNDVGRLTVYAVQNGVTGSEMWAVQESLSNTWHGGSLSATVELDSDFAVVFEALTGSHDWGTLAVDDVQVTPGVCAESVTCTFDEGLCLWTQNTFEELNWEVINEVDSLHDHSSEYGKFLALKTSPALPSEAKATLDSQPITVWDESCFSFWYNIWGPNVGSLKVGLTYPNHRSLTLWRLTGPHTDQAEWQYGSLPIPPCDPFCQVSVSGALSSVEEVGEGVIAVDEVMFTEALACAFLPGDAALNTPAPPTIPPQPTPSPGYIFSCNFESPTDPFCGWTDTSETQKWSVVRVGCESCCYT